MKSKFWPLFLSLLLSLPSTAAFAAPTCAEVLRSVWGNIEFVQAEVWGVPLTYLKTTTPHNEFKPIEIAKGHSERDLYIGFTGGHTYFVHNGQRYDGGLSIVGVPSHINHRSELLSPGVVVRVRDLPTDMSQKLTAYLTNHKVGLTLTCSSGVCRVLRSNGMEMEGFGNLIPSRMLRNLVVNGVMTEANQKLEVELYLVNSPSLERHLEFSRKTELAMGLTNTVSWLAIIGMSFLR